VPGQSGCEAAACSYLLTFVPADVQSSFGQAKVTVPPRSDPTGGLPHV
jgi:hypothetical protein